VLAPAAEAPTTTYTTCNHWLPQSPPGLALDYLKKDKQLEIIRERFCLFLKHCLPYQLGKLELPHKVVVISKMKEWKNYDCSWKAPLARFN